MPQPGTPKSAPEFPETESLEKKEVAVLTLPKDAGCARKISEGDNALRQFFRSEVSAVPSRFAEGLVNLVNVMSTTKPDVVVFLDKSARPLYWGVRPLWKRLNPGVALPTVRFLNMGKSEFGETVEEERLEDPELRRGLQRLFGRSLDGKRVLVADEYAWTGETIVRVVETLREDFPAAKTIIPTVVWVQSGMPEWYGCEGYTGVRERSIEEIREATKARESDKGVKEVYGGFVTTGIGQGQKSSIEASGPKRERQENEPPHKESARLRWLLTRFSSQLAERVNVRQVDPSQQAPASLNLPTAVIDQLSDVEGVQIEI